MLHQPGALSHHTLTSLLRAQYFYIDQYIYQSVIALTKISIVLLYLRIFPKSVSRPFAYTSWALIAALVVYGGGFIVYCAFQCAPVSYFWTQWDGEHEGRCSNFQLAVYLNSGFNMVCSRCSTVLVRILTIVPVCLILAHKNSPRNSLPSEKVSRRCRTPSHPTMKYD